MTWSHRATEIDNRQGQVLIDDSFRSRMPIRELPTLSWIGVYCRSNPGGAFWHPDETVALDSLEDDLMRVCEQFGRGWAVYVMRIDTYGIREYYLYSGESADLGAAVTALKAAHPEYRIDFDQKADPEWERYRTFLPHEESRSSPSLFRRLFPKK